MTETVPDGRVGERSKKMAPEAHDYLQECNALYALLAPLPDEAFSWKTLFKDWTINDIVGHLHLGDRAAAVTLDGDEAYGAFRAFFVTAQAQGVPLTTATAQWLGGLKGQALLQRWHESTGEVARCYDEVDAGKRVAWGSVRMSARSCITARLMETWSHAQAVYDRLGKVREEQDRIKGIAVLGVKTFGFSFFNRDLEPPAETPYVRLVAPSGAIWSWGAPDAQSSVEGSAVEFCQVVTQTRNVADTKLVITGDTGRRWMAIAQCFAGAPQEPPPPGIRHLQF